ncbi:MAG: hypothetical protein RLZZ458_3585 [Planctomycetota bacterium]
MSVSTPGQGCSVAPVSNVFKESVYGRMVRAADRMDRVLRSDFCPSLNRWVYWLKDPFWCLLLALGLSMVVGIFVNPMVLLLSGVLGALAALAAVLPWLTMRGLECSVSVEQSRGRVGESLGIRLRIRNRRVWPAWGVALTGGFPAAVGEDQFLSGGGVGLALAKIPACSEMEFVWRLKPGTHGSYPADIPQLETGFPFGIFRARRPVNVEGRAIVWPATVILSGLPDAPAAGGQEESLSDRAAGESGDLLGTRLFRAGDSLRRVHWAQTARQQQLVVSERQSQGGSLVRVLVDSRRESYCGADAGTGGRALWELVVRTAASVCESVHQQHGRLELVLCGRRYETGESVQGFRQLMDALSTAEPCDESTGAARMTRRALRGGVTFTVSTLVGIRRGLDAEGVVGLGGRRICVSAGEPSADSGAISGDWKRIHGSLELAARLPRLWKEYCHVR